MITLNQNITTDIFIRGGWFTNNTTVNIEGITINSTTIVDDDTIRVNITTPTSDGFHNVDVTNEGGKTTFGNAIEIKLSSWVDLRQGGETFVNGTDIRVRTGMTINRDADGMYFTGLNPWESWVKFESLSWNREDSLTLQWIISAPSSFMMIGIGSNATNENSNSQFNQGESMAYFNNSSNFWGLYGNDGNVGSTGFFRQGDGVIDPTGFLKLTFENSGGQGSLFTLSQIPTGDPSDWDSVGSIIKQYNISNTLNPDEQNIMPFIIPRTDSQRFLALKIE